MNTLRSWRALLVREYLEHRMAFLYFPLGIVVVLVLSAASALGFHRVKLMLGVITPSGMKLFELGYFALLAIWLVYLGVSLFFYFGDAFSADRRNNAMFFWKSLPVSDLKIVLSKYFAGTALFPALILAIAAVTGLLLYLFVNVATVLLPGLIVPEPFEALASFLQITGFAIVYLIVAMLWYAPFLAWLGGLSTVFGRWSLPLAFVIPGLAAIVENVVSFGQGPRGGYFLAYLGRRWQFGLGDEDYGQIFMRNVPFDAPATIARLFAVTDWFSVLTGLLFAAIVLWLASEYRRRRIG